MLIYIASATVLLIGLATILRMIPLYLSPEGAGTDHWFWKKYIETLRKERRFPPTLPQYVLDEHQWYPPLFPLLIAMIPTKLFERWSHVLALGLDLLRMLLLLFVAFYLTQGDLWVLTLSGLIYATTPIQISYNFQLNPRGLAALFLDMLLVLLLSFYSYSATIWVWSLVVFLSGLILLTHKMTTQLFWFICLCCSVLYQNLALLLLIPASVLMAILLSKGFYLKVFRAHWDIIRFWRHHWRWIGADVVRESPIYGNEAYQRTEKLHKIGVRGFLWYCFILFGFNPACWVACSLIFEKIFITPHVLIYSSWLICWLLIPCLLALLTTFIPLFRCIGAGYLYLYNTSFITSLLLATAYRYTKSPHMSLFVYSTALIFNILGIYLFYRKFSKNKHTRLDQSFLKMIEKLKTLPIGTVWCIPASWHEPIAYKTPHFVLWGAHGYGFKQLTATFPRILLPINEIIKRYNLRYLLTMEGCLTKQCVADMPNNTITLHEGNYLLYVFTDSGKL